jgi:hypothetical protein
MACQGEEGRGREGDAGDQGVAGEGRRSDGLNLPSGDAHLPTATIAGIH